MAYLSVEQNKISTIKKAGEIRARAGSPCTLGLSLILSIEELRALTGRIQSDAQTHELDLIGIPYKRRSNKSVVVMRIAVEIVLNNGNVRIQLYEPTLHLS